MDSPYHRKHNIRRNFAGSYDSPVCLKNAVLTVAYRASIPTTIALDAAAELPEPIVEFLLSTHFL
jgi:hypothetical protein